MTPTDVAALKAAYQAERLAACPTGDHMALIVFGGFGTWAKSLGIELPDPDPNDPSFVAYTRHRESAFRGMPPSPNRDAVEKHFLSFYDWLSGHELHVALWPNEPSPYL